MAFDLLVWVLVFIAGMIVLIKSSDYFTEAAEKVGAHFGLPAFMIGVTIVALGTSLPELSASLLAVFAGATEIVAGDVVGSNIANILLVLGVAAIAAKKLEITWELIKIDMPLLVGSAVMLAIACMDGMFTFLEALIFLAGYAIYIFYTREVRKNHLIEGLGKKVEKAKLNWRTIAILIASVIFVYVGARLVIESTLQISSMLFVGTELIALTAIAVGTSLPELTVSAVAARKGRSEIAIGNVLGSNIFNTFAVMGVSGLFGALVVPVSLLYLSIPIMLGATFMYFFVTQDKEVTKWEGWILVLIYLVFLVALLGL